MSSSPAPSTLERVGGKLANFRSRWKRFAGSPVVGWVSSGVRFKFTSKPGDNFAHRIPKDSEREILRAAIKEMLEKDVIERVPVRERFRGVYSPLSTVAKKGSSKRRPILDLRWLNSHIVPEHFKMEGLADAKNLLSENSYMTKLDLKDAFNHILVHKDHRRYFRFMFENDHFQWKALGFGVSSAPRLFTKTLAPVIGVLRKDGYKVVRYIDDLLLIWNSEEEAKSGTKEVVRVLESFGFTINTEKSVFVPAQRMEFLGFVIDTTENSLSLSKAKMSGIKKEAKKIWNNGSISPRKLASFLGTISAAAQAFPQARLMVSHLMKFKNFHAQKSWDKAWDLHTNELNELLWWFKSASHASSAPLWPPPPYTTLTTDASHTGWGAWLSEGLSTHGSFSEQEAMLSSNKREALAVRLGVESLVKARSNSCWVSIKVRTDNTSIMRYLSRRGGRVWGLESILHPLVWDLLEKKVWIVVEHIPGEENSRADALSRMKRDNQDWCLNKEIFWKIARVLGTPSVDLFASRLNCQVPHYFSRFPDPKAMGTNCFLHRWPQNCLLWANPPFVLLKKTLWYFKTYGGNSTLILLCPGWKSASWWTSLLELATQPPLIIPPQMGIFSPIQHRRVQFPAPNWSAHVWTLSNDSEERKDFQKLLLSFWLNPGLQTRTRHMREVGRNGWSGLYEWVLTHSSFLRLD